MNNLSSVSVCILSQNHELYIGQLIDSLAAQIEKEFDIYYLDNCSDDRTYEVALQEFKKYKLNVKFKFKNIEKKNIPHNLNILVTQARGENLLTISADDWLTPDSISEKVGLLSLRRDLVAVCSSVFSYQEHNGEISIIETVDHDPLKQFENLMLGKFLYPAPGVMFRKRVLEEVGYFDENIEVEDYDIWLALSLKGTIGTISKPLAYYRRHADNLTSPNNIEKYHWMIENIYKSMVKYSTHPVFDEALGAFSSRVFYRKLDYVNPKTFFEIASFIRSFYSWKKVGPIIFREYIKWRFKELFK